MYGWVQCHNGERAPLPPTLGSLWLVACDVSARWYGDKQSLLHSISCSNTVDCWTRDGQAIHTAVDCMALSCIGRLLDTYCSKYTLNSLPEDPSPFHVNSSPTPGMCSLITGSLIGKALAFASRALGRYCNALATIVLMSFLLGRKSLPKPFQKKKRI